MQNHPHNYHGFKEIKFTLILQVVQLNDVYTLELDGGDSAQWSLQQCSGTYPEPRWRHIGATVNDETMVIFGGIGSKSKRFNDACILDVSTEVPGWVEYKVTGTVPCPRAHHSGTIVDNQVPSLLFHPFCIWRLLAKLSLRWAARRFRWVRRTRPTTSVLQ